MNLTIRQRQPELMDQPGLEVAAHRAALAGIGRINGLSRIGNVLWREIEHVISQKNLNTVRVLDLACGGGDLAICLGRHALRHGFDFSIDGFDISRTAVEHAQSQAVAMKVGNVQFFQQDALNDSYRKNGDGKYDIVMCSLFLHHLEENQAVKLLQRMAEASCHAVILDDLRRTRLGYGLAWIGCRLLSRSPLVHVDGPLSVQGAFSVDEVQTLAERAGLQNAQIIKHWPQRFLMTWQRA